MKTIIAGSRTIHDYQIVLNAVRLAGWAITEVFSGCAGGIDKLGEQWAVEHSIPLRRFPADWKNQGRIAGPVRNGQMANAADALIAVWNGKSPVTRDMIDQAKGRKLMIYIHHV